MPWTPTDQEISATLAADGQRRYEYFLHRVGQTRRLYALFNDGWASLGDEAEKLIPFWPHSVYADSFRTDEWAPFSPVAVELDEFLQRWIPGMKRESVGAAIFPVPGGSAVVVTLDDLEAHLRLEVGELDPPAE